MKVVLWKDTFEQTDKEKEDVYELHSKRWVLFNSSLYLGSTSSTHL